MKNQDVKRNIEKLINQNITIKLKVNYGFEFDCVPVDAKETFLVFYDLRDKKLDSVFWIDIISYELV